MNIDNKIPKMRTINESVAKIKSSDVDSAITANFIRSLVKQNKVRYVLSGSRTLVDFDDLIAYLYGVKVVL